MIPGTAPLQPFLDEAYDLEDRGFVLAQDLQSLVRVSEAVNW